MTDQEEKKEPSNLFMGTMFAIGVAGILAATTPYSCIAYQQIRHGIDLPDVVEGLTKEFPARENIVTLLKNSVEVIEQYGSERRFYCADWKEKEFVRSSRIGQFKEDDLHIVLRKGSGLTLDKEIYVMDDDKLVLDGIIRGREDKSYHMLLYVPGQWENRINDLAQQLKNPNVKQV